VAADLLAINVGALLALTGAGVSAFVLGAFIALIVVVPVGLITVLQALVALVLIPSVALVLAIITATVATMQPNLARLHVKHNYMQRLVILEEQLVDLVTDLARQWEESPSFGLGLVHVCKRCWAVCMFPVMIEGID
jgi:hypothetical protein